MKAATDVLVKVKEIHSQSFEAKKQNFPHFSAGDTVTVHARITEGQKSRIQAFRGTVISVSRFGTLNGNFRVRKISSGVGVERVFPFFGTAVDKVVVESRGKTRRAKMYFLRDRSGKSARVAMDYDKREDGEHEARAARPVVPAPVTAKVAKTTSKKEKTVKK